MKKTVILVCFLLIYNFSFSQKKGFDFSLPDKDKNNISLHQFVGKVVYLTFWGTGCTYSSYYQEMKQLQYKLRNYKDIIFINICTKTDYEKWLQLASNNIPSGINLFGNDNVENLYHVDEWPYNIIIGKNGDILGRNPDMVDYVLIRARNNITAGKSINEVIRNIRNPEKNEYLAKYLQERFKHEQDSTYSFSVF
jgi:hypothetical protein